MPLPCGLGHVRENWANTARPAAAVLVPPGGLGRRTGGRPDALGERGARQVRRRRAGLRQAPDCWSVSGRSPRSTPPVADLARPFADPAKRRGDAEPHGDAGKPPGDVDRIPGRAHRSWTPTEQVRQRRWVVMTTQPLAPPPQLSGPAASSPPLTSPPAAPVQPAG